MPLIALEAVLLRAENERIDVEEAVEELSKSSFIEEITSEQDKEIFLSVPLAASLFGKGELEVSPDKVAILLDRDLLQEFGAAQQSDIVNVFKPRIQRKFNNIANQISRGKADLETHRPTLEFIASKYPDGWIYLFHIFEENNNLDKGLDYLREFIKTDVDDEEKKEVWQLLADIYSNKKDWFNRVNALVEKCSLSKNSLFDISEVANEINRHFQQNNLDLDSEVKEKIILKIATTMESKMSEATATDYSRLAWLYLHLKNENQARVMTCIGLEKDPYNEYCNNLASSALLPKFLD